MVFSALNLQLMGKRGRGDSVVNNEIEVDAMLKDGR
jgi:hypothetical protein